MAECFLYWHAKEGNPVRRYIALLLIAAGCGSTDFVETGVAQPQPEKVFVCKYVGKPFVDERLQTGQNPISVSVNAIPISPVTIYSEFADRQGRSLVIAFDTGQSEPPPQCPPPKGPENTTTTTIHETTTTLPNETTTTNFTSTTTSTTNTTTSIPSTSTTQPVRPQTFAFAGATTVCRSEVPTIVIDFQNTFPTLAGRTGTLEMFDVNGNLVSSQSLVYQPGAHVELLYPGTSVNPDGTIADVPGWILQSNGLWIRDPSDAFLREGILLRYTINPTAEAFITYPPESSICANPENPPGTPGTPETPPAIPPARLKR